MQESTSPGATDDKNTYYKYAFYSLFWAAAGFLDDLESIRSIHLLVQVASKKWAPGLKSC